MNTDKYAIYEEDANFKTQTMKRIISILILFTLTQICFGQKKYSRIDSLSSGADVEKIINSFIKGSEKFQLIPITEYNSRYRSEISPKRIADSLHITKSFYKSDFDKNGYTDLMAIGEYYGFQIFVVMNYGHDSLNLKRLTRRSFQECTFPKIINDTIIKYYFMSEPEWKDKPRVKITRLNSINLIYKYGDFIERNPKPKNYSIDKIEYKTTMCFGECPEFYFSIDKNKSAIFRAEAYNVEKKSSKEMKGTFKTIIKDNSFTEIIDLLNYIDFPNLNDNYSVPWTDDQSCTLTITYDNGKVKTIRDYGLIGTFGLDRLYELLFNLRFNQDWK